MPEAIVEFIEKADGADGPDVRVIASAYNVLDRQGDRVKPGAFRGVRAGTPLLFNHNHSDPVGKVLRWIDTSTALIAECSFDDTDRGRTVREQCRNGSVPFASISFLLRKGDSEYQPDGFRDITGGEVIELSMCTVPANPEARVLSAKGLDLGDAEVVLKDADDGTAADDEASETPAQESAEDSHPYYGIARVLDQHHVHPALRAAVLSHAHRVLGKPGEGHGHHVKKAEEAAAELPPTVLTPSSVEALAKARKRFAVGG